MEKGSLYIALYFIVLVALYYVCIVIPGKRRKREHDLMQRSVKVGNQIVTVGGILGTVSEAGPETLVIEVSEDGNKIQILRAAVQLIRTKA